MRPQPALATTPADPVTGSAAQEPTTDSIERRLGAIVHDFNNVLAAIHGYGALLLEDLPESSTERTFAARILTAADSGKALVADLSELRGTLARQRDAAPANEGRGAARSVPGEANDASAKIRVLVVDDEPVVGELVSRMLARVGYEAECCRDPVDALARFEASPNRWKAVITDQSMPGMTGEELAARLKAVMPGLPVILCTGNTDDLQQGNPAVSAIVAKPASREQLDQAIKTALLHARN